MPQKINALELQFMSQRIYHFAILSLLTLTLNSIASSNLEKDKVASDLSTQNNYTIALIQDCRQNVTAERNSYSLFSTNHQHSKPIDLSQLGFIGWNHTANGSTSEWIGLTHPEEFYAFNSIATPNKSCNLAATLNMLLVKKLSDWNHQHANGFERKIKSSEYQFGNISELILELKINSKNTRINSPSQLKLIYANWVTATEIEKLDQGKANIGITLYGQGNQRTSVIIEIDQIKLIDLWLRVTIPFNKMDFYEENNYLRSYKTLNELSTAVIKGVLIVAETKSGSVLRSSLSQWKESLPESFKEIDVDFKDIELRSTLSTHPQ